MLSTLILRVLFTFLLIIQALTRVSALPTSTTITTLSAWLETRQLEASDSTGTLKNNDNTHSHGYNAIPHSNSATSKFAPPPYQAVASPTIEFTTQATLSQFVKRDNSEDQKHDSDNISSGEMLSIIIAALTLLVGIIPLLRSRFHLWVSSISSAMKRALGIKPPTPTPPAPENPSSYPAPMPHPTHIHLAPMSHPSYIRPAPMLHIHPAPVPHIHPAPIPHIHPLPMPHPIHILPAPMPHPIHIHQNHSNAQAISTSSNTFLCSRDGIVMGDGRVPQVGELSAPRRPERTATSPLPSGPSMGLAEVRYSEAVSPESEIKGLKRVLSSANGDSESQEFLRHLLMSDIPAPSTIANIPAKQFG